MSRRRSYQTGRRKSLHLDRGTGQEGREKEGAGTAGHITNIEGTEVMQSTASLDGYKNLNPETHNNTP